MTVAAPERETVSLLPQGDEYQRHLDKRTRRAWVFKIVCLSALTIAVLALATLIFTIVNDSFGLVAVVHEQQPEAVVASLGYDPAEVTISDLSEDELVGLLEASITTGVGRRLEREQRFFADRLVWENEATWADICAASEPPTGCTLPPRDHAGFVQLVYERVVVPDIILTNQLLPSMLNPDDFRRRVEEGFAADRFPPHTFEDATIEWRAWFNMSFLRSANSSVPEVAGIRTAILGSAWLVVITVGFAVPVGVGAAIYLVEYAKPNRLNGIIQTNINNLAGVPSIVYGMLGLAILVRALERLTSGALFGVSGGSGRSILAAGVTLGLLTLPVVIISSQEALKAVPDSLRHAGLALGATRWQTVRSQVLPVALPGILTGTILAVARAIGETAPLILVGAASYIASDPTGPFSRFTALPIQIFQWSSYPQPEFRNLAAAASIALLILLLTLNAVAILMRNRFSRRVE